MDCRDCPYIKTQFDILDSGCHESSGMSNEIKNRIFEKCFCQTTDDMICLNGRCGNVYPDKPENKNRFREKIRNKRERNLRYKRRLKRLSELPGGFSGAIYDDRGAKPYYRRYYRSGRRNNRFKYYLKCAETKVRKYKGDIHKGGAYRKVFDFWWFVD